MRAKDKSERGDGPAVNEAEMRLPRVAGEIGMEAHRTREGWGPG